MYPFIYFNSNFPVFDKPQGTPFQAQPPSISYFRKPLSPLLGRKASLKSRLIWLHKLVSRLLLILKLNVGHFSSFAWWKLVCRIEQYCSSLNLISSWLSSEVTVVVLHGWSSWCSYILGCTFCCNTVKTRDKEPALLQVSPSSYRNDN